MTYAFIHDVPANDEIYGKIRTELGDEAPAGLISHVVIRQPTGLRYVDVWRSQAEWERFRVERVDPVVTRVLAGYGIPHDESQTHMEEVDVIDTWIGTA